MPPLLNIHQSGVPTVLFGFYMASAFGGPGGMVTGIASALVSAPLSGQCFLNSLQLLLHQEPEGSCSKFGWPVSRSGPLSPSEGSNP